MLTALDVPLGTDADGVIRVGNTRVTVDTVIWAFNQGQTPETIVQKFPAVSLADVYAVIAYYLQHQSELIEYLQARASIAKQVRLENEARFDQSALHARLLAQLEAKKQQAN